MGFASGIPADLLIPIPQTRIITGFAALRLACQTVGFWGILARKCSVRPKVLAKVLATTPSRGNEKSAQP